MTLTHGLSTHTQADRAIVMEAQIGRLFQNAPSHLQKTAQANAPQPPLVLGMQTARLKSRPIRQTQGLIHDRFKLTAVVDHGIGRGIGHLRGWNHVDATQGHPVHAQLRCGQIQQTLHHQNRLRSPCTAVGALRHGVGQGQFRRHADAGNPIHTGQTILGVVGAHDRDVSRGVSPNAHHQVGLQGQDASLTIKGHSGFEA